MIEYYLLEFIEDINTTGLYNINDIINKIISKNTTYLSTLPREIIDIIISNIPITINIGDIIKDDACNYFKIICKVVNKGEYNYHYIDFDFDFYLPYYIIDTNYIIRRYYAVLYMNDDYEYPIDLDRGYVFSYAIDIYNVYEVYEVYKDSCNIV